MTLREENPLIASDLDLIIDAFEKAMVKSEDIDSTFVPFQRELMAFSSYPESIKEAIDKVPNDNSSQEETTNNDQLNSLVPTVQQSSLINSPLLQGDATSDDSINEDTQNDEWTEKIKNWVTECIPCTGDLKRTVSSMNADFFADIGAEWDKTLDKTWDKLTDLENLIDDADITPPFCELGNILKGNCVPDIEKITFILKSFLGKMETEISIDLGIFDSFLTEALSPVFNELAANLDLIDTLALKPIRCVLDNIEYQITHAPQLAENSRAAIVNPVQKNLREQRNRMVTALRRELSETSSNLSSQPVEAERLARRARYEQELRKINESYAENMRSALDRGARTFENTKDSINFLDSFQEYLKSGTEWLENKKEWLLSLVEEFVNDGLDRWNRQLSFSKNKKDLLTFVSILTAISDAARNGDLSCGPESGSMTEEDLIKIVDYLKHPSESLVITVEDGNITTRRVPGIINPGLQEETGQQDGSGGISTGGEGPDSNYNQLGNVVVRRPISSCLKKITDDEADTIHQWIRQLEQEV